MDEVHIANSSPEAKISSNALINCFPAVLILLVSRRQVFSLKRSEQEANYFAVSRFQSSIPRLELGDFYSSVQISTFQFKIGLSVLPPDEDWEQEAKILLPGRSVSHLNRVIHSLWRNKKQPVYTVELQTEDSIQAHERYEQLLTQHAGPKLTNKKRVGV